MLTAVGLRGLQLRPISIAVLSLLGNAIDEAVGILQKYGGSLWIADPAYTFTGSDGTGAAGDNSDAGYVRDLCATYGAELWISPTIGAEWSVSGGTYVFNSPTGAYSEIQVSGLAASKQYQVSFSTNVVANAVTLRSNDAVIGPQYYSGAYSVVVTGVTDLSFTRLTNGIPANFSVSNISVREIIGRPLTQATTGFKPKLKRVPKRLGAELVTNGDFAAGSAGWFAGTNWAISGGVATHSAASVTTLTQLLNTLAGKQYLTSLQITAVTTPGSGVSVRLGTGGAGSVLGGFDSAVGTYTYVLTPTADQTALQLIPRGTSGDWVGSVDNVSVREVLEWGWAWVFDGVDDLLATVAQPAAASETLIVAKRLFALPPSTRTAMAKAGTNTGVELYANASVYNNSQIGTGSGYVYKSYQGAVGTAVHSAVVTPTSRQIRVNGISAGVEAITFASAAATIKVGGGTAAFNGEIFAAAYIPGTPTDAEMLIIERAMGQVGGIAI